MRQYCIQKKGGIALWLYRLNFNNSQGNSWLTAFGLLLAQNG